MSELIDLREIEKKAWKSFFQDGIWDITLGVLLLAFTVGAFMDTLNINDGVRMAAYIGVELIAFAWLFIGKRYISRRTKSGNCHRFCYGRYRYISCGD